MHEDTQLRAPIPALIIAICPKRFLNLSESTVLHALRQIIFNRCAGREPGSSPRPRIRVPLPEQSIRSVEAPDQTEWATGPAARLLHGEDGLHPRPSGGEPGLAVRPRRYLVPAPERRLPSLRLRPDQPAQPRLRAPAVHLPLLPEERLAHARVPLPKCMSPLPRSTLPKRCVSAHHYAAFLILLAIFLYFS